MKTSGAPALLSKRLFKVASSQRGNALLTLALAILLTMIVAALASAKYASVANDAAAEATGRYLLTVKGAVQEAVSKHYAALTLIDTSAAPAGIYPAPPAWAQFAGNIQTISVKDLKSSSLLRDDFPDAPPLGRSVHVKLFRQNCPGLDCQFRAFAYTCWPLARARSPANVDVANCPAEPGGWEADGALVGGAVMAMDGYGGSNSINAARVNGALINMPAADLGFTSRGHAVISASLDTTMFNQFVRQGDSRHIFLNDDLSVAGQISTDKGLLINTEVVVGATCDVPGLYGTSNRQSLVICTGGSWFEMANHTIMGAQSLADGATVVAPSCPGAAMEPFAYASLQTLDSTMTGSDVNVRGNVAGTITGTGQTNKTGSVSVSGTYTGAVQSSPDSSIRVAQSVAITGGRVVITPADPRARALVVQGCRYL